MNFDYIYKEYHDKILNFCYLRLGDKELAEDCTQEVFLILAQKMDTLKLSTDISLWLHKTAKLRIMQYYKKHRDYIPLDEIEDIPQDITESLGIFEDIITDDEYKTLNDFLVNGEDIKKLADDRSISLSAMYQRIKRIKQKIIKSSDKLHRFFKK